MRQISLRLSRSGVIALVALMIFAGCVVATALQEPMPLQRVFVAVLIVCTFGVLLFSLGRMATALVLSGGLFLALKFIATLKQQYLESALLPSDFIYYANTSLLDTLRHYPHLYALGLALCLMVPPLLYVAWRWDRKILATRPRWHARTLRLAGVLLSLLVFWLSMLPTGLFAAVHSRNVWEKLSDDAQLTNFFVNYHDSDITMPAMSSDVVAEQQWGATASDQPLAAPPPYPDIVQVLEESTFDPSNFTACTVPACHVSMFRPDARTRGTGLLRTHTFGGGTWVSEFATLTGMPQDIFGPGGMYAPFVLAPHVRDSLALQLHRLGYQTIAIYPTEGTFINGRDAYKAYGFDHLYDVNELGLAEWDETDKQMFDAAKRTYDKVKKPGQPVFIMILTINQHGPHDDPMTTLPPAFRNLLRGVSQDLALNFDTYLSRLHDSDLAMRGLERDFLDRPQPTVLTHFGDHQPSFSGLISDLQRTLPQSLRPQRDYLTYYMIKSNFAGAPLPSYPMLDIALLPSMVLQAAGVPRGAYFSAATSLRDRCHGLYDDCALPGLVESYHGWIFDRLHVYQ